VILTSYLMFGFTVIVGTAESKTLVGWIFVSAIVVMVGSNFVILLLVQTKTLAKSWKKTRVRYRKLKARQRQAYAADELITQQPKMTTLSNLMSKLRQYYDTLKELFSEEKSDSLD
jgi:hypothetical protein